MSMWRLSKSEPKASFLPKTNDAQTDNHLSVATFCFFVENKSVPGTSLGHVISFVQFVNDLDFFLLDSE